MQNKQNIKSDSKKIASGWMRLIAAIIDSTLWFLFFLILINWISRANDLQPLLDSLLSTIIILLISYVLWQIVQALLTSKLGGSIGKLITGIKVVNQSGKTLTFKRALFREQIGKATSSLFFGLGYFWIIIDDKNQGWHDMVTGSKVVKEGKYGIGLGILGLASLFIINFLVISSTISNFQRNKHIYLNLIQDAAREIQRTINEVD